MNLMRTRTALVFLLAAGLLAPVASAQSPEEATVFICGVWPDRVLFFDQTTDEFREGLRLRHGAVTRSSYTHDKRRFFLVTDRMESVEVVDPVRREVVDELKLSTPGRRIRIFGVFPNYDGTEVYLTVSAVSLETDRFIPEEDVQIVHYDLVKDEVLEEFTLPREVSGRGRPNLHVSPDGALYVIGRDIYELDPATREVRDTLELSKPLHPGYGGLRGLSLTSTEEPGVFYGIYRTQDPFLEKDLFGVAQLDLYGKNVETFELGPGIRARQFALSRDETRGYAGLKDAAVIDMRSKKVLLLKENFERGRANTSMIVSYDGTKLYVSGVGDTVYVYDAETLEPIKNIYAGGDFMMPPVEIPNPAASPTKNKP